MKQYGLLIYDFKRVINIGDYIQSLAAKQYLPQVDYLVDRESLHQYSGSKIDMIMNGWYMHNPSHWPPSDSIHPFYISLHINASCEKELLRKESISHFKKYEPIGCRDIRTKELLEKKGVECYFSCCLTTTLGNTYKIKDSKLRKGYYFVDPYIPFADTPHNLSSLLDAVFLFFSGLKFLITKRSLVSKISNDLYKDEYGITFTARFISKNPIYKVFYKIFSKLAPPIFSIIFLSLYSKKFSWELLEEANFIPHLYLASNFKSEEDKFKLAESLIRKYSEAQLIITSRIHSALPCLALETPHIYIQHPHGTSAQASKRHHSRFKGLTNLFNNIAYKNRELHGTTKGKITTTTQIRNNGEHLNIASALTKKCKEQFNH